MKLSGFTMVRNADKFYFPIKESISSVLPIVDEYIVALGDNSPEDKTRELIESINSPKIKIIDRIWSENDFKDGKIFAKETSFALNNCSGDWCIYLQADELIHENDFDAITSACKVYKNKTEVEGLLFKYYHFWGDYEHYLPYHGWYKNEIRIVRNNIGIYSYKDAQSFRKAENEKLKVKEIDARIYHYGWVRPPHMMQAKKEEQDSIHHGKDAVKNNYKFKSDEFDYGALGRIKRFEGTHPIVLKGFMQKIGWKEKLNYTRKAEFSRPKVKHEKLKYRLLSFFEKTFNRGKDFVGYTNWIKV